MFIVYPIYFDEVRKVPGFHLRAYNYNVCKSGMSVREDSKYEGTVLVGVGVVNLTKCSQLLPNWTPLPP